MKSLRFAIFALALAPCETIAQSSDDFRISPFVSLYPTRFSPAPVENAHANFSCKIASPYVYDCVLAYKTIPANRFIYSVRTSPATGAVKSYLYSVPLNQELAHYRGAPGKFFSSYNLHLQILISRLRALDSERKLAVWRSSYGRGFCWVTSDAIFFEACRDFKDCIEVAKQHPSLFSSATLKCAPKKLELPEKETDFAQRCGPEFENDIR